MDLTRFQEKDFIYWVSFLIYLMADGKLFPGHLLAQKINFDHL